MGLRELELTQVVKEQLGRVEQNRIADTLRLPGHHRKQSIYYRNTILSRKGRRGESFIHARPRNSKCRLSCSTSSLGVARRSTSRRSQPSRSTGLSSWVSLG